MEKQQTRSPTKTIPINDALIGMTPPRVRQSGGNDKPSRGAISRCINIWASVYRLRDDSDQQHDMRELTMPSRTWAGRRAPDIDRFE